MSKKPYLSLSLDLDNTWSYLKIHGDKSWETAPSHFAKFIPTVLPFLKNHQLNVTFFIVGKDAANPSEKEYLKEIVQAGHSVGNHSFQHEPWMQKRSVDEIVSELQQAHDAIFQATGLAPQGFRGPGFCLSKNLLEALIQINYKFDASVLATSLGPLARAYYRLNTTKLDKEEEEKRDVLFGSFSNSFLPNKPFIWDSTKGTLLEVPVTTLPFVRTPIHLSYILWLLQFSKTLSWGYLKSWIHACKLGNVAPSLLLHPPDFFGKEQVPEISFFPGMGLSQETKLEYLSEVFDELKKHFETISLNDFVHTLDTQNLTKKPLTRLST